MIGLAVLSYSMDKIMKMYGGIFSIQIHWEVMSNHRLSFFGSSRNSKLFVTSQGIWIEKNPTVHLHYFIHRVKQNCQNNLFPFLRECFLVRFFKFLNLKNRWCDDVTWFLSTIFMKDHREECFGKTSHPYRVWKVYKQRFLENTYLAIWRTLKKCLSKFAMCGGRLPFLCQTSYSTMPTLQLYWEAWGGVTEFVWILQLSDGTRVIPAWVHEYAYTVERPPGFFNIHVEWEQL